MSRTYHYAGVSRLNGRFKVRFCDRISYVNALATTGNTDIDIIQLIEPMNKIDAVKYLLSINFDNGNADIRAALESNLETRMDRERAKSQHLDDPVRYLREIASRLAELNTLVAQLTNSDLLADDHDGTESDTHSTTPQHGQQFHTD
jgi:hypothetical protein